MSIYKEHLLKKQKRDLYIVSSKMLILSLSERLSIPKPKMEYYFYSLFDIIKEHLLNFEPISIGNFGTLSRKRSDREVCYNHVKKAVEKLKVTVNKICFNPSRSFLLWAKDEKNMVILNKIIANKNDIAFETEKNNKKRHFSL